MKISKYLLFLFLFLFFDCSKIIEPVGRELNDDIQKEFLIRNFKYETKSHWHYEELNYYKMTGMDLMSWSTHEQLIQELKKANNDRRFRRIGTLMLVDGYTVNTKNLLIDLLNNDQDNVVRFNAAQILAFHGNNQGINILNQCIIGELILSASAYERDAAALALLLLDEELPKEYKEWQFADPLYLRISK